MFVVFFLIDQKINSNKVSKLLLGTIVFECCSVIIAKLKKNLLITSLNLLYCYFKATLCLGLQLLLTLTQCLLQACPYEDVCLSCQSLVLSECLKERTHCAQSLIKLAYDVM